MLIQMPYVATVISSAPGPNQSHLDRQKAAKFVLILCFSLPRRYRASLRRAPRTAKTLKRFGVPSHPRLNQELNQVRHLHLTLLRIGVAAEDIRDARTDW